MIPPLPNDRSSLVLRRMFMASRQRVFRAWIEPDVLKQWFKPFGKNLTIDELDVRVGGTFRFDADCYTTVGTYLSVVPPEKLVFTWSTSDTPPEQDSVVTLDFHEQGQMTEIVLTHERLHASGMHKLFSAGWMSLFDTLSAYLYDGASKITADSTSY
jgi:uncharacterized protein YndB with AHSA1/START domain